MPTNFVAWFTDSLTTTLITTFFKTLMLWNFSNVTDSCLISVPALLHVVSSTACLGLLSCWADCGRITSWVAKKLMEFFAGTYFAFSPLVAFWFQGYSKDYHSELQFGKAYIYFLTSDKILRIWAKMIKNILRRFLV